MIDQGWWTKVLVDDDGNIRDVDFITEDDLPKHKHDLKDIDNIEGIVKNLLASFFVDHDDSTVRFTFNRDTSGDGVGSTVEASVKIDEDTIKRNEFGELYVDVAGLADRSSEESSIDLESFKLDILNEVQKSRAPYITEATNGALSIEKKDNAFVVGVKVDDYTIHVNPETNELEVDTDVLSEILGSESNVGSSGKTECGNHKHTSSQITDFQEAVLTLIRNNVTFEIDNIKDLIDDQTIKINKDGKLYVAVSGSAQSFKAHKHKIADIEDWDDSWTTKAVLQKLSFYLDYLNVESLDSSILDFSTMSIGQAFVTLDHTIAQQQELLKTLKDQISQLAALSGASHTRIVSQARLSGTKARAWHVAYGMVVDLYLHSTVAIEIPGFSSTSGSVSLLYDNSEKFATNLSDIVSKETDIFSVQWCGSRPDDKAFTLVAKLPETNEEKAHTVGVRYTDPDGKQYDTISWTICTTPFKGMTFKADYSQIKTHNKLNSQGLVTPYVDSPNVGGKIIFNPLSTARTFLPETMREGVFEFGGDLFGLVEPGQKPKATFSLPWIFETSRMTVMLPYQAELTTSKWSIVPTFVANGRSAITVVNDIVYGLKELTINNKPYFAITIDDGLYIGSQYKPDVSTIVSGAGDYILRSDYIDHDGNVVMTAIGTKDYFGDSAKEGVVFNESKLTLNDNPEFRSTTVGFSGISLAVARGVAKHYTTIYIDWSKSGSFNLNNIKKIWLS